MNRKASSTRKKKATVQPGIGKVSRLDKVPIKEPALLDLPGGNEEIILEHLEENPYQVSYTCLLLPKLNSHYLLGEVAEKVQAILEQVSTSCGWRLEFLSVKQDYVQWTIRVLPSTSTTSVMNIVRKETSLRLFADFPRFKRENHSDDFWAPGYLIFWGSQPHPGEVIQRYIRQTRKQQGVKVDE